MASSLIWIPAGAGTFGASNTPGVAQFVGTHQFLAIAFAGTNGTQDEAAYFTAKIPAFYTDGANVTFYVEWEPAATATAGHNVSFDLSYKGTAVDEATDGAYTTTVTVNRVITVAGDRHRSAFAFAAPSLVAGDLLTLKLNRDYDEANGGTAAA